MRMKQAKKLYREAHGKITACPNCSGFKEAHKDKGCKGPLKFVTYPQASPGLRAFVRAELRAEHCEGKLADVMAQVPNG